MGIDFAKFLSIIFMVATHVFMYYCGAENLNDGMFCYMNAIVSQEQS